MVTTRAAVGADGGDGDEEEDGASRTFRLSSEGVAASLPSPKSPSFMISPGGLLFGGRSLLPLPQHRHHRQPRMFRRGSAADGHTPFSPSPSSVRHDNDNSATAPPKPSPPPVRKTKLQRSPGSLSSPSAKVLLVGDNYRPSNDPLNNKQKMRKRREAKEDTRRDNARERGDDDDDYDEDRRLPAISTIAIAVDSGKQRHRKKIFDGGETSHPYGKYRRQNSSTGKAATRTTTTTAASWLASFTSPSSSSQLSPSTTVGRRKNTNRYHGGGSSSSAPSNATSTAQHYVHRPATMRTISGLGMEDPVGGGGGGTMQRGATRRQQQQQRRRPRPASIAEQDEEIKPPSFDSWYGDHPSMMIFDDMSYGAIPKDMQDLVTVASDPTADTRRGLDSNQFAAYLPNFDPDEFARAPPVPIFVVDSRRRSSSHRPSQQQQQRRHSTDAAPGRVSSSYTHSPRNYGAIIPAPRPPPPKTSLLERQVSNDAMSLSLEDLQRARDDKIRPTANGGSGGGGGGAAHASGTTTLGTSASPASDPAPGRFRATSSPRRATRRRRASLDHALDRKNRNHQYSSSFATFETSWTGNTRASTCSTAVSISTLNTNQVVAEAARWALHEKQQQQLQPQSQESSDSQILVLSQELIDGALAAVGAAALSMAPLSPVAAPSPSLHHSPRLSFDSSCELPSRRNTTSNNLWTTRGHSSDSEFGYYDYFSRRINMTLTSPSDQLMPAPHSKNPRDGEWRPSTATTTSPSSVDDYYSPIQEQRQRLLKTLLRAAPLPIQEEATHHSSTSLDQNQYRPDVSFRSDVDPTRQRDEVVAESDNDDDDITDLILLRVSPEDEPEAKPRRLDPPSSDECDDGSQSSGETIEVVVMVVDDDDDEIDRAASNRKYGTAVSSSTASCDSVEAQQLKEHVISLYVSGHASFSSQSDKKLVSAPSSPPSSTSASRLVASKPSSSFRSTSSSNVNDGPSRPPYPSFVVSTPTQDMKASGTSDVGASGKPRRMSWSHRSCQAAFQYPGTHRTSPLSHIADSEPVQVVASRRRSATGAASSYISHAPASARRRESLGTTSLDRSPDSVGTKRTLPVSMASLFPEG